MRCLLGSVYCIQVLRIGFITFKNISGDQNPLQKRGEFRKARRVEK